MGDANLSICQLCKEPVWNFICPDCIAHGIKDFLPSNFVVGFTKFHQSFLSHFRNGGLPMNTCLECKSKELTVCPYCYTHEVHSWLGKRNKSMATQFMNIFSFGFNDKPSHLPVGTEPISTDVSREDFGICDECGEYTEELVLLGGEWVCKGCSLYQNE